MWATFTLNKVLLLQNIFTFTQVLFLGTSNNVANKSHSPEVREDTRRHIVNMQLKLKLNAKIIIITKMITHLYTFFEYLRRSKLALGLNTHTVKTLTDD